MNDFEEFEGFIMGKGRDSTVFLGKCPNATERRVDVASFYQVEPGPGDKIIKTRSTTFEEDRALFVGNLLDFRYLIAHFGRAS